MPRAHTFIQQYDITWNSLYCAKRQAESNAPKIKQIRRWRIEILPAEGFGPPKIMGGCAPYLLSRPIIPHSSRPTIPHSSRPTIPHSSHMVGGLLSWVWWVCYHDFGWPKTFSRQYLNAPPTVLLHFCAVGFLSLRLTIWVIWIFIILLHWCVCSRYSTAWAKLKIGGWTLKILASALGFCPNPRTLWIFC